jgi:uncharacterized circularly permuted ATP-grasp superfamily protein
LDRENLKTSLENQDKFVIKAVDGRGGDGVWVGPKISRDAYAKAGPQVEAEPDRFIAQPFTHLSVSNGNIVDLRMISTVDKNGTLVSQTPWARGLPIDGDGKVNLSSSGRELAVIVIKDPPKKTLKRISSQTQCVLNQIAH